MHIKRPIQSPVHSPIQTLARRQAVVAVGATLAAPWVQAQPSLPETLRIVVPFPAGGALDGVARVFAETYKQATGRNCIVDNKPGAATSLGAGEVSRARPDGATVLWTTSGHLTNAVLMKRLPYQPIDSFTPLTMVYVPTGFGLLHRAGGPFNSVADVVAAAKRSPGTISYASVGNGSTPHVVGALFAKSTGIELIHVPYKSAPLTDLISGTVDLSFISASSVTQYIDARQLKVLAITGAKRTDTLPAVPTFAELGLSEVDIPAWIGLLAPPKMPPDVLAALHDGVAKTLREPAFRARMASLGNQVAGMSPAQFKAHLEAELARYRATLPQLGIEMDG